MNANDNLERGIADAYHAEAPQRAPDWVLANALETIESTPQRRVLIRVPWRFPDMNSTFGKVAIAAVAVLVIGVVGLNMLSPRGSSGVGGSAPTASPSASPSPSPSPSASSSPSTAASGPPALTATFTSTMHGLSTKYPEGWKTAPATQPASDPGLTFKSPDVDYLYDGQYTSDLFLAMASQPLGGKAPEAWITNFLDHFDGGCGAQREPLSVAGTSGVLCAGILFATTSGDRGYFVRIYTGSEIPPEWGDWYDKTWFKSLLATMQFHPQDALDAPVAS